MSTELMTWEQAVAWLRAQPDRQDLVRDFYFDDPVEAAALRFEKGEEWEAVRTLLGARLPGRVLDLAAGRGIATYAFAHAGSTVSALEPDPSALVGRGAIETLLSRTGLTAEVRDGSAEALPFPDATFDVVYGRAVLHHARDPERLCREAARVLKPGGVLLATRERVISRPEDLPVFLRDHLLHSLHGGETAYVLPRYVSAIQRAGLALDALLAPYDSPINHAPVPRADVRRVLRRRVARWVGRFLSKGTLHLVERRLIRTLNAEDQTPGRHYSFLALKR